MTGEAAGDLVEEAGLRKGGEHATDLAATVVDEERAR